MTTIENNTDYYREYLSGNDEAMTALVREYADGLQRYLQSITCDARLAEEITEDTFVKLTVKRPRFSGTSSFRTWLFSIGRNLALDRLRSEKRTSVLPIEEAENAAEDGSAEEQFFESEEKTKLYRALMRLPLQQRQVICLVYFESLDRAEICRILKKSRRQTENLLYRAKQNLKALYAQDEMERKE